MGDKKVRSPFAALVAKEMTRNLSRANAAPVDELDAAQVERDARAVPVSEGELGGDEVSPPTPATPKNSLPARRKHK